MNIKPIFFATDAECDAFWGSYAVRTNRNSDRQNALASRLLGPVKQVLDSGLEALNREHLALIKASDDAHDLECKAAADRLAEAYEASRLEHDEVSQSYRNGGTTPFQRREALDAWYARRQAAEVARDAEVNAAWKLRAAEGVAILCAWQDAVEAHLDLWEKAFPA